MSQRLIRTKFSSKKVSFLKSLNKPGSLTSEIIAYLATNPQQTAAQIESATGVKSFTKLRYSTIAPTLKPYGYELSYEIKPGDVTPLWSIFKIKEEG